MDQTVKILVTGALGFIGKNLIQELQYRGFKHIFQYDVPSKPEELVRYAKEAQFVFHLAGVNRPEHPKEFMEGNFGFTSTLLDALIKHKNHAPIVLSSSIQAELNNPYGQSKKAGEDLLMDYGQKHKVKVMIYRFPNVFGKWARPNYNSAVATFCDNTIKGLPLTINDPKAPLSLVYIDDVVAEMLRALALQPHKMGEYCYVDPVHKTTVGEVATIIQSFKGLRTSKFIPELQQPLNAKLYATYLSYLPGDQLSYDLKMNVDPRGSFTEIFKTVSQGQVSVNVAKPGITKGQHWHQNKHEKFIVVSGQASIKFRKVGEKTIHEYLVDGSQLKVVEIPPGYVHNITNIGQGDLVTIMWASEIYSPDKPDTIPLTVENL